MEDFGHYGGDNKSARGRPNATSTCCKTFAVIAIVIIIVLVSVTIYAIHFSNTNSCDQTKESLQLKQAEESNLLLRLQNCQDEVARHKDIENKITEQFHVEFHKARAAADEFKKEAERMRHAADEEKKKNHLLAIQIVELHHVHVNEINGILNDLLSTQSDIKELEEVIYKSKDRIVGRQRALNKIKEQIKETLKSKFNATLPQAN